VAERSGLVGVVLWGGRKGFGGEGACADRRGSEEGPWARGRARLRRARCAARVRSGGAASPRPPAIDDHPFGMVAGREVSFAFAAARSLRECAPGGAQAQEVAVVGPFSAPIMGRGWVRFGR